MYLEDQILNNNGKVIRSLLEAIIILKLDYEINVMSAQELDQRSQG
jgi:hypothetical protein